MSTELGALCEFGPFRLDPENRLLLREGRPVPLTPKVFDALLPLVERCGRLVLKDDLMKALWPGTFVDESNLTQTVFMLRKALGETGSEQRYVVTVPGRGYRFAARVQQVSLSSQPVVAPPVSKRESAIGHAVERSSALRKPSVLVGIAAGLVIAAAGGYFQWSRSRAHPQPSGGRQMLAVLPFENLTGDAGQDYFSDGLTEEMMSRLGGLNPQRLGVIARTSVMHYKHSQGQLDRIGRELGVQYVLEGSVRRDAEKVRITAQLIRVADQTHMWARQYDRALSNILALQGEIALEIAGEIQLTLGEGKQIGPARQASLSTSAYEAYDLCLKGRYFWNKRTDQGFQQAINHLQRAIGKDPTYARAYAGVADSYAMMGGYGLAPPDAVMPKAPAAALRAVELDEDLAEAHTSLAVIAEYYDWDWQTAEKEYRRAIELDPNYATAHHWYAECLAFQGRFDEALAESERARQLDPVSPIITADNGAILYYSRQYDRAIAQFRSAREMEPSLIRARLLLYAYVEKGRFTDALAELENWHRTDDTEGPWGVEAYVYGRSGQPVAARHALENFLERANRNRRHDPAPMLAMVYAGMNEKDEALGWLQKAFLEHSNAVTTLKVDPIYDPLRSDPRFQELQRRVRLAP